MTLPAALRADIQGAAGVQVEDAVEVGGGCITHALQLRTPEGDAFLKWGKANEFPAGMFAAEADSLRVIARREVVRVPQVRHVCDSGAGDYRWLLLEWLEPGRITRASWEQLGRSLAKLHRSTADAFGSNTSNFIGTLPQSNEWNADWPSFWRDERIMPQTERASDSGALKLRDRRRIEKMLDHIVELASAGSHDGPSLLHGDLWGGNVHGLKDGMAALIDPASYYGHREVDLAMARLFGGLDARFFEAYAEAWPLQPGAESRTQLYQLYYLLVHVNLFGGAYVAGTMASVSKLGF